LPLSARQTSTFGSAELLKPSTSTQSQGASSAIRSCTVGSVAGPELADLGQAAGRGDHHFRGAGLAMAPGVLAFVVDVELVVRVLDHDTRWPAARRAAIRRSAERGLAGTGKAAEDR
jgi:hypothetical protein